MRCVAGAGRSAASIGWSGRADNFFFAGEQAGKTSRIGLEVSSSRYSQGIVGTWRPGNTLLCFFRGLLEPSPEIRNYN